MTTLHLGTSTVRSPLRIGLLLIPLALACFALLPGAQAVVPAPDGGYGQPTYGPGNTAEGQNALSSLATGTYNTAVGWVSLQSVTGGNYNTGVGAGTLALNTADSNTAVGAAALLLNTSGTENTATGWGALIRNDTGIENTASGAFALFSNTGTASDNTANGAGALYSNTTGGDNTAIGWGALSSNTTGGGNIALGINAGILLTTGFGNIDIGNPGVAGESNTIRIGTFQPETYIAGIVGAPNFSDTVKIDPASGQLGDQSSSARFKKDIDPMDKTSEAIFSLKPVTFHYKNDKTNTPQFGLIAEEVTKVNPALIGVDKEGKPYCVQYDKVNAMLLNEFLKEHRMVQELKSIVAKQEATAVRQQKQIEALTAGLQKVSAQLAAASPSRGGLEASKFATGRIRRGGPAPQVVLNNQ